jgi:RimJ/RimL family protein N-acetyltransferase
MREAEEADSEALAAFACSKGEPYADEVERFIRNDALQAAAQIEGYRFFLAVEEKRIVGCAGYHPRPVLLEDDTLVDTSRIHTLALALTDQGRRFTDGTRLSDLILTSVLTHALHTLGYSMATAVAARGNYRSIAVCERNGLRSQVDHGPDHVLLFGHFASGH